ncbi:ATP-binding cassette domain-containing protein [Roseivirga sp.]|uniref:ATP-binding cassette domain-containing protein n=1 Tax=Roseivirga sp. TaxID=1964215 RepID=UPI003B8AA091
MKLEVDGVFYEAGGKTILSDIYLNLPIGETVGILGRNGSGKSTLFELMFSARKTKNISLRIDGTKVKNLFNNRLVQYLPQYGYLPDTLTLSSAYKYMGLAYAPIEGLFQSNPKTKIGHLSFGQKRLVEIDLLLESASKFILLDEPFSGLSPLSIELLKTKIELKKAEKGMLITDHLYGDILSISDRLLIMESGALKPISKNADALEFAGYLNSNDQQKNFQLKGIDNP